MPAGIYVRISSDPTGQRAGVDRQREDCTALCRSRGWPVAEVYTDNDASAYSGKRRPDYERLIADIEAGRLTHIISWHPDRLHRQPVELEAFIELIGRHKVRVATVQAGDWDLSTAAGQLNARMLGAVARYESQHKSERIRRAKRQRAEQGKPTGGGRRFGYQADGVTLEPAEAAVARDAARRLLAGESLRAICNLLQQAEVRTVTGVPWHPTVLRQIISSPRAGGLRVHRGDVIGPGAWEPLLDTDTWHAVRALLANPDRRDAPSTARVHLLTNIATCGACGTGLLPHRTRTRGHLAESYACRACHKVAVRKAALERYVVLALHAWWTDNQQWTPREETTGVSDVGQQIAALRLRMDQAAEQFADDDDVTPEQLRAMTRRWTLRLTELEAEQARQRQSRVMHSWSAGDIAAQWEAADLDRRRALLVACFERIVVRPANGSRIVDERRVELVWTAT